jgi:hypothetical protein
MSPRLKLTGDQLLAHQVALYRAADDGSDDPREYGIGSLDGVRRAWAAYGEKFKALHDSVTRALASPLSPGAASVLEEAPEALSDLEDEAAVDDLWVIGEAIAGGCMKPNGIEQFRSKKERECAENEVAWASERATKEAEKELDAARIAPALARAKAWVDDFIAGHDSADLIARLKALVVANETAMSEECSLCAARAPSRRSRPRLSARRREAPDDARPASRIAGDGHGALRPAFGACVQLTCLDSRITCKACLRLALRLATGGR